MMKMIMMKMIMNYDVNPFLTSLTILSVCGKHEIYF